jgi:hypothetical protein
MRGKAKNINEKKGVVYKETRLFQWQDITGLIYLAILASYVAGFEMLRVLYFIFPFNSPQTKGNSF